MTSCGVLAALGVSAFASIQIAGNDGVPKVNGVQHLGLFARPNERSEPGALALNPGGASGAVRVAKAPQPGAGALDFSQTASIARPTPDGGREPLDAGARSSTPGYRIRHVLADRAILERGGETLIMRIGETATGVGQLKAIVLREGRFVAIIGPEGSDAQISR